MAHDFVAVAPAAQHCAELVARGPRPEERAAAIAAWRRDLARHCASGLGALLSGDRLNAEVSAPETLSGAAVLERIGPVAANSLLRCAAVNRRGKPCGREPLRGLRYCPSHQHLASSEDDGRLPAYPGS